MVSGMLRVKISPPPLRAHTLQRPHILNHLQHGLTVRHGFTRPLTLVSAPAGYGKTTLVRTWLAGREKTVCWYSLDTEDSQPERFWFYVIEALRRVHPGVGAAALDTLRSDSTAGSTDATATTVLTPLLNDLFALETPTFLVLDDYHHIADSRISDAMTFFVENLPPMLHVIVITRSDPPWPLARYRAKGQMVEVRLRDLRFNTEETEELLKTLTNVSLTPEHTKILWNKTEGWVTGLQLASNSLTQSDNVSQFIADFAGSHRHVLHFLSEEILNRQSTAVQEFLLQTSILDRFCTELCDTVLQSTTSRTVLTELETKNVFIISLDEFGHWYRYHPLFADLLKHRLQNSHPEQISVLHGRAVQWYLDQGEPGEAVYHAIRSDRLPEAARILDRHEIRIIQAENPWHFRRSLELLPEELLRKHPRLLIHKALHHLIYHGQEKAAETLALAEQSLRAGPEGSHEAVGILAATKAYYYVCLHRFSEAMVHAQQALDLLPADDHYWRMNVAIYSGDAHLFAGNPGTAYQYYLQAQKASEHMANRLARLTTGFKVATSLAHLGRLHTAQELLEELIQSCQDAGLGQVPRVGLLWTLLGELKREAGLLTEAERCVERGLLYSESETPSYAWNCLTKVALHVSLRQWIQALQTLDEVAALHDTRALPRFVTDAAAQWRARVLLFLGRLDASQELLAAQGIAAGHSVQPGTEYGYLVLARLLAEANHTESAQRLLVQILDISRHGEHAKLRLETSLLQAQLAARSGSSQECYDYLDEALYTALRFGFYQTWLDTVGHQPDFCLPFLERNAVATKPIAALAQQLLVALQSETTAAASMTRTGQYPANQQPSPPLIEELSPRELDVLCLIGEGLSNDGIAQQLFLSLGTVKWHTSNIYGKLGVRNRTKAVALAREMGILP